MQTLVAEHKLGVQGRKLGVAMTRELVNTPKRLAYVKPAAGTSWAAIKQRRNNARTAGHSHRVTSSPVNRSPRLDRSPTTAAQAAAESAEAAGDAELGSSEVSGGESDAEGGVPTDTMRSTVKFTSPELIEDGAQVMPQKKNNTSSE